MARIFCSSVNMFYLLRVQEIVRIPITVKHRGVDMTDETMRNWLKQAVRRAEADGVHFSIPVTPHTFRHSYIMHMLYHRQPRKVIQALAGHRDPRSMEVYTRVFALDMAATLAVPFSGDGRDAAEILRTLPPLR